MATTKFVSIAKLGRYDGKIKTFINEADAATLAAAKEHAEGLGVNYDAAGAAATAESNAKKYADGKDTAIQAAQAAAESAASAASVADGKAVAAQNAANAAQTDVDNLEKLVGTLPEGTDATTVFDYVNKKTEGIATDAALGELQDAVDAVEGEVATIKGDYLKAADKTELEGKITAEENRAKGVESGLDNRVKAIEGDYLKAADKTELVESIEENAAAIERLTNGVSQEEIDGVNDLINYVNEHGTEVTGMKKDISDNAAAITAEANRAKAAESANATAAANAQTAAEGAQAAVEAEVTRATGVESGLDTRLQAVEGKLGTGEGSVDSKIATAKQEAINTAAADATTKANKALEDGKKYTDEEIDKVEATVEELTETVGTKASQSDLTALTGRVTTAEGKITTLEGKMDTVEGKAAANETAISNLTTTVGTKAAQSDLTAAVNRIAAVEAWQANMVECSEEDIDALFA